MAVEERIEKRFGKIEDNVATLTGEVTTLTERVDTHITQVAADRKEAKIENKDRHQEQMTLAETTLEAVRDNKVELRIIKALDNDREKRPGGGFPQMNGKAKLAAGGAGLTAALALAYDIVKHVFD